MSEYIHKSHNVTVLMYHFVFPAKYRRVVFDTHGDENMIGKYVKNQGQEYNKLYEDRQQALF